MSASSATRATAVQVEPDFDFSASEYNGLFARCSATAFEHPLWLSLFYERLAPCRGADKLVVTLRDQGRLVGVLPMIRRRMSGVSLVEAADLGVSDYSAPVIENGWLPSPSMPEQILSALAPFDWLRVRPVRSEHVEAWRCLLGGDAVPLEFSAHATTLAGSFADWRRKALTSSHAKYIDRRKKRFFRNGAGQLRLLQDPWEIARAIEAIRTLRAGRFEGDPIQQDFTRDFYAAVAAEGAAAGLARTYVLEHEGQAIGYVFGLTHDRRFHYLLIGCDYERHGRHSPGLLLYDGLIEDWMNAGGSVFDFTIGDEPFKRDFGTQPTAMFMLTQAPTWRGRLARAAYNIREELRSRRGAHGKHESLSTDGGTDGGQS